MRISTLAITAAVCLAGLAGCQMPPARAAEIPTPPRSVQPLEGGQAMFQTNCGTITIVTTETNCPGVTSSCISTS